MGVPRPALSSCPRGFWEMQVMGEKPLSLPSSPALERREGTTRWQCWLRSPDRQAPFELECVEFSPPPPPAYLFPNSQQGSGIHIFFLKKIKLNLKIRTSLLIQGEDSGKVPRSCQCSQSQADSISGRGSPAHLESSSKTVASKLCTLSAPHP